MLPLYPGAPLYTSLVDRRRLGGAFDGVEIRTSWMQHIPGAPRAFRALLPLYPRAFEALDLRAFDLVISSTTSFAKGVITRPDALHVSYVNTPTRFLWYPQEYAEDIVPAPARPLLRAMIPGLRRWDYSAAQRPQRMIANSHNVAERIRACYHRDCDVVPCPVDVDAFAPSDAIDDYYLVAARLLPYKRVALAIEACSMLRTPLVVIGTGPDANRLRRQASVGVRFAGSVGDEERRELFARARAVIVPGVEDFGLVALEAAASGRPVIAFAGGGSLETVVEGETGSFFHEASAQSLADVMRTFDPAAYDRGRMLAHAQAFSPARFRERLRSLIDGYLHS